MGIDDPGIPRRRDAVGFDRLREMFHSDGAGERDSDEAVASQVVSACSSLNDWLRSSHPPRGMAKAGGELGAAAGVYRNAAVAFRSLADVDGDQRQAQVPTSTLEQGE
jgi:hypothetical protein